MEDTSEQVSLHQVLTSQIRCSSWQPFEAEGTEPSIYLINLMNVVPVAWIQDIVEILPRLNPDPWVITSCCSCWHHVIHVGANYIIRDNSEHTENAHSVLGSSVKGRGDRGGVLNSNTEEKRLKSGCSPTPGHVQSKAYQWESEEQTNMGGIVVDACYKPYKTRGKVNEASLS